MLSVRSYVTHSVSAPVKFDIETLLRSRQPHYYRHSSSP